MIKNFILLIKNFWTNWLSVAMFLLGIAFISIAAFLFNLILGYAVTGMLFIMMAVILTKERGDN